MVSLNDGEMPYMYIVLVSIFVAEVFFFLAESVNIIDANNVNAIIFLII